MGKPVTMNKSHAEHALWKRKKTGVAKPSSGLLSAKPPNKRKARQLQKLLMHARNDAQRELLAAGVTKGDIDRMLLDGETSKKAAAAAAPKAK